MAGTSCGRRNSWQYKQSSSSSTPKSSGCAVNFGFIALAVIAVILLALMTGCSGSSIPQPVCRTDAPTGQHWVAVPGSVSASNPNGVCQLVNDKDGKVIDTAAGEKSFADWFKAAAKKVEEVGTCYNDTGMGTTCVHTAIK